MPRRKRETPKKKAMTSAERRAMWRLRHSRNSTARLTPAQDVIGPPSLLLACHPRGEVSLDELDGSAAKTTALYN